MNSSLGDHCFDCCFVSGMKCETHDSSIVTILKKLKKTCVKEFVRYAILRNDYRVTLVVIYKLSI